MPAPDYFYKRPLNVKTRTGAGGVVARVDRDPGKVLIALIRERGDDEYVLPKGGVEKGESLERAAAREIAEEAGFTRLRLLGELGKGERLSGRRTTWQTTHYFLFLTDQEKGKPTDRREWELEWFPIDALPPIYWPEQQKVLAENLDRIRESVTKAANRGG
jgi:8-oxo-dGTP pyrophosphatase MutT (NUDIX family)